MKIIYVNPTTTGYKPREGDVKILDSGKRFVRRQIRVHDGQGRVIGREVSHGRPCFEWVESPAPTPERLPLESLLRFP